MAKGILFGQDQAVAQAIFQTYGIVPILYNEAIGILDDEQFAGGILLHWWNGCNIHVSYYGPDTVTLGICRAVCQHVLKRYNVSRITVTVPRSKKRLTQWLQKIGASHEGNMRCYYGLADVPASIACQYAIMRPQIERLAWRQMADKTRQVFARHLTTTEKRPTTMHLH